MSDILKEFPRVPILGVKKPEVVCHYVHGSAVIGCDCGSPLPVIVPAFDRAGICLACKTKYVIAELHFTNANGDVQIQTKVAKWRGPMSASADLDVSLTRGGTAQ